MVSDLGYNRDEKVLIRISPEVKEQLRESAKKTQLTMSDLVRNRFYSLASEILEKTGSND